jgi:hypothetical protein
MFIQTVKISLPQLLLDSKAYCCSHVSFNDPYESISILVRFEVFTAMTMKDVVFWDITRSYLTRNTLRLC